MTRSRRVGKNPAAIAFVAVAGALAVAAVVHQDHAASPAVPSAPPISTESATPRISFARPAEPPAAPVTADGPSGQAGDSDPSASLATLATLPIKGRAPKTGYDRALFGQAWSDDVTVADGHNGCDTRNDMLRRDLVAVEIKPGTNGCVVLRGTLHDPYTGTTVEFVRGRQSSKQVQIDHLVALSDAWQKGAQQWDEAKRRNFANDPINLQATIGSINEQKGDGDAATWLPPNKSYRCTYASRIVDVKSVYGLWVTQAEHDAIARILTDCTSSPLTAPANVAPGRL
jgi:hypothetical protein